EWSFWEKRQEGKAAMVAASELGSEGVSNERERMSQEFRSCRLPAHPEQCVEHILWATSQSFPSSIEETTGGITDHGKKTYCDSIGGVRIRICVCSARERRD